MRDVNEHRRRVRAVAVLLVYASADLSLAAAWADLLFPGIAPSTSVFMFLASADTLFKVSVAPDRDMAQSGDARRDLFHFKICQLAQSSSPNDPIRNNMIELVEHKQLVCVWWQWHRDALDGRCIDHITQVCVG